MLVSHSFIAVYGITSRTKLYKDIPKAAISYNKSNVSPDTVHKHMH